MTKHSTRQIRIFQLGRNDVMGTYFSVVRSGTWAEVTAYLRTRAAYVPCGGLFIETETGLKPLFA